MELDEFIAWTVDFEGCISIHCNHDRSVRYYPQIEIRGTSLALLTAFRERVQLGYVNPTPRMSDHNDQFTWRMRIDEIGRKLSDFEPYLTLKREQAQLVLALLRQEDCSHALYEQCRLLNLRQIKPKTPQAEMLRLLKRR